MKCYRCPRPAIEGMTLSVEGVEHPVCLQCAAEFFDVPINPEQTQASCGGCRRRISYEVPLFFHHKFWHKECLESALKKERFDPRKLATLVDQAYKDAFSIMAKGNLSKVCKICLAFNTATSLGLPFYSQEPREVEHICFNCYGGICEAHTEHAPKGNILGIDPALPICHGSWVSSCYRDFEEQVACCAEECETKSSGFDREFYKWNPLINSKQCEKCSRYYCNFDHEECPVCVGVPCEGCSELTPPDELFFAQEGMRGYNVCEDCYSNMICYGCSEIIARPGETDTEYGGLCEYCAEKSDDYERCKECDKVVPVEEAHEVHYDIESEYLDKVCEECFADYRQCSSCENFVQEDELENDVCSGCREEEE